MSSRDDFEIGDVAQIDPSWPNETGFGGALVLISSVHSWGAQGSVLVPHKGGQRAMEVPVRVPFEFLERVGHAAWVLA